MAEDTLEAEALLESVTDAMSANIAVLDENAIIVHVNESWKRFARENGYAGNGFGLGTSYLAGGGCGDDEITRAIRDILAGRRDGFRQDYACDSPDRKRWFQMRIAPARIDARLRLLVIHEDITELKLAEARLWRMAHLHDITGLPNRTLFLERLDRLLGDGTPVGIGLLGIEGFDSINAIFGTPVGDRVLADLAAVASEAVGEDGLLGHWMGGQFAFALGGIRSPEGLLARAQVLTGAIHDRARVDGRDLAVAVKAGLALPPADGLRAAELMGRADIALQAARARSCDQALFEPAMNEAALAELRMEAALAEALAGDQFELHYQPQVDASTGLLCGAEALLRWHHPVDGTIPPSTFIPLAERRGLMHRIGRWVIERTCRDLGRWLADGLDPVPVALNVSPQQLERPGFATELRAIAAAAKVPADLIEVEVTESMLVGGGAVAEANIDELRAFGFRMAIDDFGTGYSNLSTLHRLPIHKVKIDRSFIQGLGEPGADAVVQAIVTLADALSLNVLAEGVETAEQMSRLMDRRCVTMQGFLFGRPTREAEFLDLLARQSPRPAGKIPCFN